jgi:hypothetical protein
MYRLAYNDDAVRPAPIHVHIKGCDQVALPRLGERISPAEGHLIVAHYEVVGKGVKDSSVPEGRTNPQSLARIRPRERKQPIDRPLRDGSLLKKPDPPLRSGLLSNGPLLLRPAVARSTKGSSGLPTSPNCPQSFIEGWGYVGQAGTRSSPNAT